MSVNSELLTKPKLFLSLLDDPFRSFLKERWKDRFVVINRLWLQWVQKRVDD